MGTGYHILISVTAICSLSSKTVSPEGKITVSFDITNTGKYEGAETVQMYINDVQCSVDRPEQELKGFKKVSLKPRRQRKLSSPSIKQC